MSNFMFISIVAVTLFVMTVTVIDHIEVSRHARMMQEDLLRNWKDNFDVAQHRAFLDGDGNVDHFGSFSGLRWFIIGVVGYAKMQKRVSRCIRRPPPFYQILYHFRFFGVGS